MGAVQWARAAREKERWGPFVIQTERGEGVRPASRLGMGLSLGRGGRMAAGLLGHQADGAEVSSPFFVFFSFSFLIHFPKPFLNKILNANNFKTKAISIK